MLYLPTSLDLWYRNKARERNLETGEILYYVMRQYAEQNGFSCNHPADRQVLHKKGNKTLWRCANCGYLYYKIFDKVAETFSKTPRIDVL